MKVILFDFFGVLSTPVYKKVIDTYIPESERPDWVKKLDVLDVGDLSEKDLTAQIAERGKVSKEAVQKTVDDAPVRNEALFAYIENTLQEKYRVGLLTNIPRSLLERIAGEKLSLFDPLLVSSDLRLIKPDKAIFYVAIERSGVPAEEILFVDDGEKNIASAREVGFKGILYTDFPTFLEDCKPYL